MKNKLKIEFKKQNRHRTVTNSDKAMTKAENKNQSKNKKVYNVKIASFHD